MEKKNKKSKLWVRVMAWVLAGLMVVSIAFYSIYMVVENIREAEKTEQT